MSEPADRMRLDVWLWRARFFKTRGAAAAAIEAGGVRVERDGLVRRLEKASALVAPGDVIVAPSPRGAKAVRILALPERRGPAPEAAGCYEPAG